MNKFKFFKWQIYLSRTQIALISLLNLCIILMLAFVIDKYPNLHQNLIQANITQAEYLETIKYNIADLKIFDLLVSLFLSFYLAKKYFGYIHNRIAIDLVNALPIKRSQLYLILTGAALTVLIITISIPTILHILVIAIIDHSSGVLTSILPIMLGNLSEILVISIANFMLLVAIMLMLGNTGESLVIGFYIQIILPIFNVLLMAMLAIYLQIYDPNNIMPESRYTMFLSPLSQSNGKEHLSNWYWLCFIVIFFLINAYLFNKRQSEEAGKSAGKTLIYKIVLLATVLITMLIVSLIFIQSFKTTALRLLLPIGLITALVTLTIIQTIFVKGKKDWGKSLSLSIIPVAAYILILFGMRYDVLNLIDKSRIMFIDPAKKPINVTIEDYKVNDPELLEKLIDQEKKLYTGIKNAKPYGYMTIGKIIEKHQKEANTEKNIFVKFTNADGEVHKCYVPNILSQTLSQSKKPEHYLLQKTIESGAFKFQESLIYANNKDQNIIFDSNYERQIRTKKAMDARPQPYVSLNLAQFVYDTIKEEGKFVETTSNKDLEFIFFDGLQTINDFEIWDKTNQAINDKFMHAKDQMTVKSQYIETIKVDKIIRLIGPKSKALAEIISADDDLIPNSVYEANYEILKPYLDYNDSNFIDDTVFSPYGNW